MGERLIWKNTSQYRRIMEILHDYWLTEPDEEYVEIKMYFLKSNGESQEKTIVWRNIQEDD